MSATSEVVADKRVVAIYYTLTNAEGRTLDSNRNGGKPLVYLHGAGNIVKGLEKGLDGAKRGEIRDVVVSPEEGYGEPKEELFEELPRSAFDPSMKLEPGMILRGQTPDGQPLQARIAEVGEEQVRIDRNHPLAGVELHFNIYIYGVRDAKPEELEHGHAHGPGGHQH
jgi:FKBP-type peptidyl-prolyl cis-trans isomerase SlyD